MADDARTPTTRVRNATTTGFRWGVGTWLAVIGSASFFLALIVAAPGVWIRIGFAAWIVLGSLLAGVVYRVDKLRADTGNEWRVPEQVLRKLARFGGWPGAWITMQGYRHKVRKTAFVVDFWCDVFIHLLGCAVLIGLAQTVWPTNAP